MISHLPAFDLLDYRDLLLALKQSGYELVTVGEMNAVETGLLACLRHDIDFYPSPALAMARCEAEEGVRATYYFLLSGPYNLLSAENRRLLHEILDMGHEIGLHYDLEVYADNAEAAREDLIEEMRVLESICGKRVSTISTHCRIRMGGTGSGKATSGSIRMTPAGKRICFT